MKIKPIHAFFMGIIGLAFGLMVDNMLAAKHIYPEKPARNIQVKVEDDAKNQQAVSTDDNNKNQEVQSYLDYFPHLLDQNDAPQTILQG